MADEGFRSPELRVCERGAAGGLPARRFQRGRGVEGVWEREAGAPALPSAAKSWFQCARSATSAAPGSSATRCPAGHSSASPTRRSSSAAAAPSRAGPGPSSTAPPPLPMEGLPQMQFRRGTQLRCCQRAS